MWGTWAVTRYTAAIQAEAGGLLRRGTLENDRRRLGTGVRLPSPPPLPRSRKALRGFSAVGHQGHWLATLAVVWPHVTERRSCVERDEARDGVRCFGRSDGRLGLSVSVSSGLGLARPDVGDVEWQRVTGSRFHRVRLPLPVASVAGSRNGGVVPMWRAVKRGNSRPGRDAPYPPHAAGHPAIGTQSVSGFAPARACGSPPWKRKFPAALSSSTVPDATMWKIGAPWKRKPARPLRYTTGRRDALLSLRQRLRELRQHFLAKFDLLLRGQSTLLELEPAEVNIDVGGGHPVLEFLAW